MERVCCCKLGPEMGRRGLGIGGGGGTRLRLPSLQVREEVRTEPDGVCKPNHRMLQDEGAEWRPRR